jgi:hypothetical protein
MWDAEASCSHTKDEADEGEAAAGILKTAVSPDRRKREREKIRPSQQNAWMRI